VQWSTYQEAIYAFVEDSNAGNGVVQSVAGSGKTTTLAECGQRISGKAHFCAFNKHIAEELGRRLPTKVNSTTIHRLGYAILMKSGYTFDVRETKYADICEMVVRMKHPQADVADLVPILDVLEPLAQMSRLTLTDPSDPEALLRMALQYDLDVGTQNSWEVACRHLPRVLEAGRALAKGEGGKPGPRGVIDFGDMVWLPWVEGLWPHQRDWVFVDEAQDLNRAQLELVLTAVVPDGRVVACGDAGQAIYAWSGADSRSMATITAHTQARELPLSICYRCPASHVALAATIHPQIEARPGAPWGIIEGDIPEREALVRMRPGDLVICRVNAPLAGLAYDLIRRGIPAKVRGRDIGRGLVSLVQHVVKMPGFALKDFPAWVEEYRQRQEADLIRRAREGVEMALIALKDRCETVVAIYKSIKPSGLEHFVRAVGDLFSDEEGGVVWLSSIHRAKGDEAERVYILRPDLLPHPRARTPQQQEQEQNLRYVAFTRTKEALSFVGGPAPRGWA
jgi:AAA domain/UvrD-like helicase C-terminal domain